MPWLQRGDLIPGVRLAVVCIGIGNIIKKKTPVEEVPTQVLYCIITLHSTVRFAVTAPEVVGTPREHIQKVLQEMNRRSAGTASRGSAYSAMASTVPLSVPRVTGFR